MLSHGCLCKSLTAASEPAAAEGGMKDWIVVRNDLVLFCIEFLNNVLIRVDSCIIDIPNCK